MTEYELITKVAYVMMLLTLLGLNLTGFTSSWLNLEAQINQSHQEDYRKMAIAQNIHGMDMSYGQLQQVYGGFTDDRIYWYDPQSGVIPVEFFLEETPQQYRYSVNDDHCYFEFIPGLDGEEYGFFIQRLEDDSFDNDRARELSCTTPYTTDNSVHLPALLVRKATDNPYLPVRITVYEVPEE